MPPTERTRTNLPSCPSDPHLRQLGFFRPSTPSSTSLKAFFLFFDAPDTSGTVLSLRCSSRGTRKSSFPRCRPSESSPKTGFVLVFPHLSHVSVLTFPSFLSASLPSRGAILNRLIAWGLISCKLFPPALLHSFTRKRKTFVRRSSSVLFFFPLSRRDLSARRRSSSHRSDSPRTLGHNQTSPRSQTSTPRPRWRKCSPGSDPETFDPRQTRHRYLEREEDVPLGYRSTYRERILR